MADEHDLAGPGGPKAKVEAQPTPSARAEAGVEEARDAAAYGQRHVDELRRRIDQIDDQLMKLLNARSACAVEIGRIKRRLGMPVYQPDREKWILEKVARNNPGPLDPGAVRRVFERVIDESRRLERLAGEAEGEGGAKRRQEGD